MLGIIRRHSERGDTIIEVIFAITVFSLLAVGSLSIMNQGTAAAQRSLELTLVRQQIDGQAEALRYMQSSYIDAFASSAPYSPSSPAGQWVNAISKGVNGATTYGTCTAPGSAFIVNSRTVQVQNGPTVLKTADTYAKVSYTPSFRAAGIWIEAVKSSSFDDPLNKSPYVDFHIRACWDGPGLDVPMTTGTIVRLYEPRK